MSDGTEWYVENLWECTTCKAENKGRNLNCQKCGARKSPDAKEWMPGDDKPVTDPEMLRQAKAGPNWVCEYCGGQERDLRGDCTQCGGPKAHEKEPIPTAQVKSYHGVANSTPIHIPGLKDKAVGWVKNNPGTVFIIAGSTVCVGILVWFGVWLFTPRYVDTRVTSTTWEYVENLRTREVRHNADWGHTYTAGFYHEATFNQQCETRYYGTESCHPHDCNPHPVTYSCNCRSYTGNCSTSCSSGRNGYSRCSRSCSSYTRCSTCSRIAYDTCWDQCPVYRDWCSYDYYEWPISQTQRTSGDDHNVHWPGIVAGDNQRVEKISKYDVLFLCPKDNDKFEYVPDGLIDYNRFFVGDEWTLRVGKIRTHNIEKMTKKRR